MRSGRQRSSAGIENLSHVLRGRSNSLLKTIPLSEESYPLFLKYVYAEVLLYSISHISLPCFPYIYLCIFIYVPPPHSKKVSVNLTEIL